MLSSPPLPAGANLVPRCVYAVMTLSPLQRARVHRLGSRIPHGPTAESQPDKQTVTVRLIYEPFRHGTWTFQFSAAAQGADSVLAGNSPSKGAANRESRRFIPTLRTDSSPLCTSHPQACAQASPGLPRRQPRDCRRRCQAPEPRDARFMPAMGPLLPPQGKEGSPDSFRTPMIGQSSASPSPTTGKGPGAGTTLIQC
jgi:hypothetical protein